jgi:hypothetical protein
MSEGLTEREAVLATRIKELEDAQKKAAIATVQGGIFEGLWASCKRGGPAMACSSRIGGLLRPLRARGLPWGTNRRC